MGWIIRFTVPGTPVAKARPRVGGVRYTKAGKVVPLIYTPKSTHAYEEAVGWAAKQAMMEHGFDITKGKASVSILIDGKGQYDLDNVAKSVLDGLTGVCYEDDRQVRSLQVEATGTGEPGICVLVGMK